MSCTKEEIEKKRLAALQKRQSKVANSSSPQTSDKLIQNQLIFSPMEPSRSGPIKCFGVSSNNIVKGYHPYEKTNLNKVAANSVPVGKVVSGTVYLISEDRFEVNPSEFCVPLINIFKGIPSKNYDPKSKLWNFSIDDYDRLMSEVAPLAPHVVLGGLPSYVLKILRENIMDPINIDLSPIEATLRHKLMPFQEEGVRFAIARRGRCLLADDMGLGKTFQALALASYYRHDWPLLIVTTSSMRDTWQSKIHELLPSVPLANIVSLATSKDAHLVADRQTEVVIVSYKISAMHSELLRSKKFGVVITDESHHLKSGKARCTAAVSGVCRSAARVLLLSGTPALSRPAELYTQLQLVQPTAFRDYIDYGKRYCDGKQNGFGWDMTGQSNLAELQVILQKKFLIRRTKEQVLTTLEDKTREIVLLDESLVKLSKKEESGLSQLANSVNVKRGSDRQAALISFFSETAILKIPAICKYIEATLKEESGKFLVFGHHKAVLDAVCDTLDRCSTRYICITGHTPAGARAELVERFQSVSSCRVGVLSVTAAGAGLTLTAAALVLFAELHWNPGVITQAEARAHRLGQQQQVRVRYLLAMSPATADTHMWPMLRDKLHVLNSVGLSKDSFEDSVIKRQDNNTNITKYLTPTKNPNDYIPGTNIRKCSMREKENTANAPSASGTNTVCDSARVKDANAADVSEIDIDQTICDSFFDEELEKSFLEDNEGDELLGNLVL